MNKEVTKYVIDIPDDIPLNPQFLVVYGTEPIGNKIRTYTIEMDETEELDSYYINEHFGQLQDDAYQKGFEDGKKEAESSEAIKQAKADAFNKGMLFKKEKIHDAFLRGVEKGKAVNDKGCEGCKYQANRELTCPCSECANNFKNQWTAKDDKIEVGDWVNIKNTDEGLGIVTKEHGNQFYILWADGSSGLWSSKGVVKTGRHFDIDKSLNEMKGTGMDDDTY